MILFDDPGGTLPPITHDPFDTSASWFFLSARRFNHYDVPPAVIAFRADKNGRVPPLVGELNYPQKIGKPITTVRRVSIRRCPRARTRRFNR